jgi:hypothetical protein
VVGTRQLPRHRRAYASPSVSSRATSSYPWPKNRPHRQHELDHRPGRQQPTAPLHPPGLSQQTGPPAPAGTPRSRARLRSSQTTAHSPAASPVQHEARRHPTSRTTLKSTVLHLAGMYHDRAFVDPLSYERLLRQHHRRSARRLRADDESQDDGEHVATQIRVELTELIVTSYVFRDVTWAPHDGETLIEEGIIDSTGVLETRQPPGSTSGSKCPKPRRCRRTGNTSGIYSRADWLGDSVCLLVTGGSDGALARPGRRWALDSADGEMTLSYCPDSSDYTPVLSKIG